MRKFSLVFFSVLIVNYFNDSDLKLCCNKNMCTLLFTSQVRFCLLKFIYNT
jgi:hypothetical protein